MNTWVASSFSSVGQNMGLMSPWSRVQTPQGASHPIPSHPIPPIFLREWPDLSPTILGFEPCFAHTQIIQ